MKQFYRPVNPYKVNQRFGENTVCTNGSKYIKCDGHNPPEGYKSLYGDKGHQGLDLAAKEGQPVYCSLGGVVRQLDTNSWSGLDVRITSFIDDVEYYHIYEHLSYIAVKVGQKVQTGEMLGWAGKTGKATGAHLHFEIHRKQPLWVKLDPETLLNEEFALTQYVSFLKSLLRTRLVDKINQLRGLLSKK